MRFDAVPTTGVNEVKFGMNREEVRRLLGSATEFYKFDDDVNTTDDFGFCHVFYDDNNECEAIEIFDEAEVYVNGLLIFQLTLRQRKKRLEILSKMMKD